MSIARVLLLAASLPMTAAYAQAPRPGTVPPAPQPGVEAPAAAEAPALGRLFFTPAERARLDDLRQRPPVAPQEPVAAAKPEPPRRPPGPEYVTLNGVVRRSDGSTTVWLNNKPVRGQETEQGVIVAPSARGGAPGNVTVRVPQTGRSVDLKVGQQLEVNSGEVKEGYRTSRAAAAAAAAEPAAVEPPAAASSPRRPSKERDLLRDLLREIEGPPAGQGGANESPKPPTAAPSSPR